MKTILIPRTILDAFYLEVTEDYSFPDPYEVHGTYVQCNWGGLQITLSSCGEYAFIVQDWAGPELKVSNEVIEIEHDDDDNAFVSFCDTNYYLHEFIKTR